ncbi:unnamed protein product [Caenorhabditis bovis]|uniref:leucine--tRNA ligase n=1 Tax=Caenorhabditis bovis TaxID=2654633 RepID=A0A8S1F514_9PELO|nr:unnamed protein product [Caenorhabditis bovis]
MCAILRVIHPIGWDSFGLPAENAARNQGVDPGDWTRRNIEAMREQLKKTRILFDWNREISTCEPEFFKWTQWIFCRLFEKGLVKRCTAEVNWDPVDQTVLAAEQIDSEGRSWRSGARAEKKKLRQWMVETPKYAKRLQQGLAAMSTQWGEVADIQSNWIGKCDAFRFILPVRVGKCDGDRSLIDETLDLRILNIFDIANSNFVVLRKNHPLADKSAREFPYKLDYEVLNGVTGRYMDVIVVDDSYDSDAVFNLDARLGDARSDAPLMSQFGIEVSKRKLDLNRNDITEIAAFGGYGGYETSRHLTDWVVSRQRGWGTPIPMVLQIDGPDAIAVRDDELPVMSTMRGKTVECAALGGIGIIDNDTLDTFFDSSWYYLRYLDKFNETSIISRENARKMPVDVYVGGIEHAAVHMFFARFVAYFLHDIGVLPIVEPFTDVIPQGIVRGRTFVENSSGRYVSPDEIVRNGNEWVLKTDNSSKIDAVFEKMSKSKNNGVDLAAILDVDGVDMTRMRLLESAAPRAPINWGETDMKGTKKWLDRIGSIVQNVRKVTNCSKIDDGKEMLIRESYNFFVRNVGMCLEVLHLHNTAIMRLQGFTNVIRKIPPEYLAGSPEGMRALKSLIIMLQVFTPHVAAELWDHLDGSQSTIMAQKWPQVDEDAEIDFLLMIDGVSCGRPTVDRRKIENLNFDELQERSRRVEHSQFRAMLDMSRVALKFNEVSRRAGFHVTLHAETTSGSRDENRKIIGTILDRIQAEKREKTSSSSSRKRKSK